MLVPALLPLPGSVRAAAVVPDDSVRIAILKSAPDVTLSGEGLLVTGDDGQAISLQLPVMVKPLKNGLGVNGKFFRRLTFVSSAAVYVNSKPYRGVTELSFAEKGILVVNQLPLEEYLVGLINCEISSAWPIESVKAQAVIARTYAMNRKAARQSAPYHLESSVMDQVYDGCLIEDSRALRAVNETKGEILTYSGALIQAFYHSNCGGKTEAAENVWGMSVPYLKGVDCIYCLTALPAAAWECKLSLDDIESRLRSSGYKLSGLSGIKAGVNNKSGRMQDVTVVAAKGGVTMNGNQFRKVIGFGVIKSTRFTVKIQQNEVLFSGVGNGHGVGLCQWGAKQRALDGFEYREILSYYYPGTRLQKLSEIR
ncbi:MAG TPA: SpoIID/LytB domain-containing protein [Desulfuromonadales bacterium]|nr:SpoIID/LytB domain-containing protein [Desulfuromonadales bacterium]